MTKAQTYGRYIKLIAVALASLFIFSCSQPDKAIAEIDTLIAESNIDTTKVGWKITGVPKPTQATFTEGTQYFWNLETNKGNIKIDLKAQESPMHVTSTIYLTKLGFYDDIVFHRIIPGFMAQGGDPIGEGIGGPGYYYMGEFDSELTHDKPGILSMANRGAGTDGSQFFITFGPTPHLDGRHTIFGEVVEGMETLKTLEKFGSRSGKTKEKLFIKKATILVQ
ncbi:MAG: peptidylprolyl isomerase [Kangiellaceae bacterium]|nr:peptidylprolyl isomerase [Kangiellaceae bacterium]